MKIELLPVIELVYSRHEITAPESFSYWDYPDVWEAYHRQCLAKVGFTKQLTPYLKGYGIYRLPNISNLDLTTFVLHHLKIHHEGGFSDEPIIYLRGGYILKVNGKDVFFPQCCSELSDIHFWRNLSMGQESYCEGHPVPAIIITEDKITLDFSIPDFNEPLQPPPLQSILTIDKYALQKAVETAIEELYSFESRLENINRKNNLNIENMATKMIWYF